MAPKNLGVVSQPLDPTTSRTSGLLSSKSDPVNPLLNAHFTITRALYQIIECLSVTTESYFRQTFVTALTHLWGNGYASKASNNHDQMSWEIAESDCRIKKQMLDGKEELRGSGGETGRLKCSGKRNPREEAETEFLERSVSPRRKAIKCRSRRFYLRASAVTFSLVAGLAVDERFPLLCRTGFFRQVETNQRLLCS